MAPFTQLGLSEKSPEQLPKHHEIPHQPKVTGKRIAAVAAASLTGALLAAFMLTSGCFKGSKPGDASTQATAPPATPASTAALAPPAAPVTVSQPETKKPAHHKSRQHRVAAYKNPDYGISFRYSNNYSLMEGKDANLQWDGLGPVETNFVLPGGSTLTALQLPPSLYPGTDFSSAFFNMSVNPQLTSEQCEQFAWPGAGGPDDERLVPEKIQVGALEFDEIQASAASAMKQADARYYHVFQNGMCYEFVLGVETAVSDDEDGEITPIDHALVFRKLNWILSTMKILPVAIPEVARESRTRRPLPKVAATSSEEELAWGGHPLRPSFSRLSTDLLRYSTEIHQGVTRH